MRSVRNCENPSCNKPFTPRSNVPNQKVCGGSYRETCRHCSGTTCKRCGGTGRYTRKCKDWYKGAWGQQKSPPRAIPPEDWAKIARALPKAPAWLRLVAVLGRESGMRISEMLGLTVADVKARGKVLGVIVIRGQWKSGKGGKAGKLAPTKTRNVREGLLSSDARQAIEAYMRDERRNWAPEDRLLPYTRQFIWQGWVSFQEKIGVHPPDADHYRVHDLRHTCATRLAAAGRIDLAQSCLGHSNASTTQRYNNPRPEQKLADIDAIFGGGK